MGIKQKPDTVTRMNTTILNCKNVAFCKENDSKCFCLDLNDKSIFNKCIIVDDEYCLCLCTEESDCCNEGDTCCKDRKCICICVCDTTSKTTCCDNKVACKKDAAACICIDLKEISTLNKCVPIDDNTCVCMCKDKSTCSENSCCKGKKVFLSFECIANVEEKKSCCCGDARFCEGKNSCVCLDLTVDTTFNKCIKVDEDNCICFCTDVNKCCKTECSFKKCICVNLTNEKLEECCGSKMEIVSISLNLDDESNF